MIDSLRDECQRFDINRQEIIAARFSVLHVGNCGKHSVYYFSFHLSEKLP